jgi:serine/threonine protein kinase/tetratricopeptide (TPR) repeat protein
MQERKPRIDPSQGRDATNQGGVRVPVKGESSGSNAPSHDEEPGVLDFLGVSSDPEATYVDVDSSFPDPEATLVEPILQSGASAKSNRRVRRFQAGTSLLEPGDVLGNRYEILQLLGEGGMGSVYKARDQELDRPVALKLIRPELASNPAMLARFKQELLLSRQVTHKNVIRIYDLSDAEGVKFITMEFVEGRDLRALIQEKKKFSPEEAVEIMQQVCQALEAAHSVGVIHRDLKPQNIMREDTGRILVMDFGLARTLDGDGMTQTGALVGTMEYMSPEQALSGNLDQRSDIFTAGLILYELLTGKMPFKAESVLASLIKRTQERAIPISDHDETMPGTLTAVVNKALERDPNLRYQSAVEMLRDLEAWQGNRAAATLSFHANVKPWGQTIPWPLLGGIAAILVLATIGYVFRGPIFSPSANKPASAPVLSLAILPFRNASGDADIDWLGASLAEMLSTDVGQSTRLRTVSPTSLHQIFADLRISPTTVLEPATIHRLADFSSADRVIWGSYAKFGDQIRIDATLQDIKNSRSVPLRIDVQSEKEIPVAVDRLAELIRQQLALPDTVLKELRASSFQPKSASVEALRAYNQAVGLQRDGKNLEARKQFEAATNADPKFALAFARLAQSYSALGYDSEAEQSAQKAVELSQDLPEAEKYLISAIRFQIAKNFPEAIKAYNNLATASPDNSDVQAALADLYESTGDLAKAREYDQKILAANANDINATLALGRVALTGGKAQDSLDPLSRALTLSVQLDNPEQKAAALHYLGGAYRMLNKPDEALRNYQEALAIRRQLGQKNGIASTLNGIARTQVLLGKNKEALANFGEALQIRRDIGDKRGLGDTLIDMGNLLDDHGDHDQALKMYRDALQVQRDVGNESLQASCLNNIGVVYFEKAQYEDARTYYQQALQLREKAGALGDIVDSVHNLAEVSARMGEYDQAIAQYMRALELHRKMDDARGAAMDSYTLGILFDSQGRIGAAVNAKQDAFKTFQTLQDKTTWMADIEGGYAGSLILAGRSDEAKPHLDDALSLARELKNDGLVSQTLDFQGDLANFRGDVGAARSMYEQALQAAIRSKEPDRILTAKVKLAEISVQGGKPVRAVRSLRQLAQQAEEQGVPKVALECQIYMAEGMIRSHDSTHAQAELERALLRTEKVGLKPLSTKAHFLLATILRGSGKQVEAQQHYRSTLQLLDEMAKDPGAEKILERSDLKIIHDEASHWSQGAKG